MRFFVWYDESTKKSVSEKIQEATAVYVERFTSQPNLVLVNVVDEVPITGMTVRSERTVQPNTFWLGFDADL